MVNNHLNKYKNKKEKIPYLIIKIIIFNNQIV